MKINEARRIFYKINEAVKEGDYEQAYHYERVLLKGIAQDVYHGEDCMDAAEVAVAAMDLEYPRW